MARCKSLTVIVCAKVTTAKFYIYIIDQTGGRYHIDSEADYIIGQHLLLVKTSFFIQYRISISFYLINDNATVIPFLQFLSTIYLTVLRYHIKVIGNRGNLYRKVSDAS